MATYLLTCSSKHHYETDFDSWIENIRKQGYHLDDWSCGNTKRIGYGDRVFLILLGGKDRGIFASGWVVSRVKKKKHWDPKKRKQNKKALFVDIKFDVVLEKEKMFKYELLKKGIYKEMNWTPQASGARIPDDVAETLEKDWEKFTGKKIYGRNINYPDEVEEKEVFSEGRLRKVLVNFYERNADARDKCIRKFGFNCSVCGFNFEKTYGKIGEEYIHVHHLIPISKIRKEYKLNPKKDLRPVCPNCHAMLHRKNPPYSINELKKILESNKNKLKS